MRVISFDPGTRNLGVCVIEGTCMADCRVLALERLDLNADGGGSNIAAVERELARHLQTKAWASLPSTGEETAVIIEQQFVPPGGRFSFTLPTIEHILHFHYHFLGAKHVVRVPARSKFASQTIEEVLGAELLLGEDEKKRTHRQTKALAIKAFKQLIDKFPGCREQLDRLAGKIDDVADAFLQAVYLFERLTADDVQSAT